MPLLFFLAAGLLAQFIDGTLGMGFGVVSTSILMGFGMAPALASASVHTAEIATTLASGGFHLKFGNVNKHWLIPLTIAGVVGGIAGAAILSNLSGGTMKPYVAGMLLAMGLVMIWRFAFRRAVLTGVRKMSVKRLAGMGLVAGCFDAIGGGGWGPIATPGLVLTENEEPRKVIGTVNFAEFFVTVATAATFFIILGSKSYDWPSIGMIALGGVIIAPFAAWVTKRLPPRTLGMLTGIVVVLYNARTLLKAVGVPVP